MDDEHCTHHFSGGLCLDCLGPATVHDTQRATNARENAQALIGTWYEDWHKVLTRDDAILLAWRLHHSH